MQSSHTVIVYLMRIKRSYFSCKYSKLKIGAPYKHTNTLRKIPYLQSYQQLQSLWKIFIIFYNEYFEQLQSEAML